VLRAYLTEDNVGVRELGLNLFGNTRGDRARATRSTRTGGIDREGRVKPQHVGVVLKKERH
jgi:hypothetical protein